MAEGAIPGESVFVWQENIDGNYDIIGQHLNSSGAQVWNTGAKCEVLNLTESLEDPEVIADGSGGIFVTCISDESGSNTGPFKALIQHKYSTGDNETASGLPLFSAYAEESNPVLCSDGLGGIFVAYRGFSGAASQLRVAHFNQMFQESWNKVMFSQDVSSRITFSLAPDKEDGFFLGLNDESDSNNLKAFHFDSNGDSLWMPGNGTFSHNPMVGNLSVYSDGVDGLVAIWERNPLYGEKTLAQRMDRLGFLGKNEPSMVSVVDRPNDQGGEVILSWQASHRDRLALREITEYSLWIRPGGSAPGAIVADESKTGTAELAQQLKMSEDSLQLVRDSGWIFTSTVPAILQQEYSAFCPTLGDSSDAGTILTDFMVMAHHLENGIAWPSQDYLTGNSVDNLIPGAPENLTGEAGGGFVDLEWTASGYQDEDLAYYRVYRSNTSGFIPGDNLLLSETAALILQDETASGTVFYLVTAVDGHGNESEPSNELMVEVGLSSVEDTPVSFRHHGNFPNPFNPQTNIAFDLPAAGHVRVTVFDAAGYQVADLVNETMAAGQHKVRWNGLDKRGRTVASGTYFSQVKTNQGRVTKSMSLVR